jgi:hypothetical protein
VLVSSGSSKGGAQLQDFSVEERGISAKMTIQEASEMSCLVQLVFLSEAFVDWVPFSGSTNDGRLENRGLQADFK